MGKYRIWAGLGGALALLVAIFKEPVVTFLQAASFVLILKFHGGLTWTQVMHDYQYSVREPGSGYTEATVPPEPHDDHTAKICKLSMYLKFSEEVHSGVVLGPHTDPRVSLPPVERVGAYLEVCREVYGGLPEGGLQRRLLDSLEPVPHPNQFHVNVTHPWLGARLTDARYDRGPRPEWTSLLYHGVPAPGQLAPAGSEERWARERDRMAESMPPLEGRTKSAEELRKLGPRVQRGLEELGLRPVRDEWVRAKDIPDAVRQGKVMLFDATQVCGEDVFNVSVPDLADLHGDAADQIPMFKLHSGSFGDGSYDTLAEAGRRFRRWRDIGWMDYPDYAPFPDEAEISKRDSTVLPLGILTGLLRILVCLLTLCDYSGMASLQTHILNDLRQKATQLTVNVRRLPKFPLGDMKKAMGDPGWVDFLWNLLWIGPVGDFWHFDEDDNLLICVHGTIYVALFDQNVTDVISGSRNVGLGWNDLEPFFKSADLPAGGKSWVDQNPWIRRMPLHFVKLEPGMGITVPSKTYHNVMAFDGNRVLLNNFFVPRFGAKKEGWFEPHAQSETYLAMRHLKATVLERLWSTRKVGGFFSGMKLEFM